MIRRPVALLALALLTACAGGQPAPGATAAAGGDSARPAARRVRADSRTITREEIDQYGTGLSNLYEFILRRHSDWLRSTTGRLPGAAGGAPGISVYLDGSRYGDTPDATRSIPLNSVMLVRRLGASEAEGRYGSNNNYGTIEVWTSLERMR
jgi:hypothetical protein